MRITITRLKYIFLGLFAIACAGIWAYQYWWVWPSERCERAGAWWDNATRTCAQPLYIPDITGRRPGESREDASLRRAAERALEERTARGQNYAPMTPEELAAAQAVTPEAATAQTQPVQTQPAPATPTPAG